MSVLAEVGFTWDGVPVGPDERVRVVLRRDGRVLVVDVDAPYHGDPPPPGPPGPTDRLWDHEVVELFVAGLAPAGAPVPYLEVELSPHGHHLVLDLLGVRTPIRSGLDLPYTATVGEGRWHGVARVPLGWLPARPARFNAYAIHGQGDRRRYLAMTPVPGPAPDFHRLDRFSPWPADQL